MLRPLRVSATNSVLRPATAGGLIGLLLASAPVARAQGEGDGSGFLQPLLDAIRQLRDGMGDAVGTALDEWIQTAVTYVGDRFGEAFAQKARELVQHDRGLQDLLRTLTQNPAQWTYEFGAVTAVWAIVTGIFLCFLGAPLGIGLLRLQHGRARGAIYDQGLRLLAQVILGGVLALSGLFLSSLGIYLVNLIADAIVGGIALPGMSHIDSPDAAARQGVLVFVYGIFGLLFLAERLGMIALLAITVALSGWGIGSWAWPGFEYWWRLWRRWYASLLTATVLQAICLRLADATIERAIELGWGRGPEQLSSGGVFVVAVMAITFLALAILAPVLVGGIQGGVVILAGRMATGPVRALGGQAVLNRVGGAAAAGAAAKPGGS
jgi:hypothetical protein